ncbi:MAG TPA: VOC family protein [Acidimicrobiia bacterium]|nr:VOC family protein [Acidimicrobiia bacterium]
MTELGQLLDRVGPGLFQQAYVVDDIGAAQAAMQSTLGCSAFATLPATELDYEFRGGTISCAMELAFGRSGNVQIELLQPVRGEGLHVEFLATNGPGAHHLGFLVDDLDAVVAETAYERVMGAQFGSLSFCYLDTFADFGLYVELVHDPDAMMMALMPWR